MSFLKKVLDRMTGVSDGDTKRKLTEEEILKAIDELAEEEIKKASEEKEKEDRIVKVPSVGLWSTFKYLSNVGIDENGDYRLYFVVPFSLSKDDTTNIVDYICFPYNGTFFDITERTIKI